ncbi:hypothetical protein B0T24DRAFT_673871 [Lasiosphaeria ovina]|uniref:Uncharacterized protein n=1 Tax=Lasiosphaeria ovina TaxID=92902 RepID=A0AAE0TYC9_9PEZI|nr:hypothetical protein B0T24DRAFT_673871 [Lasiosphaeria ovina]
MSPSTQQGAAVYSNNSSMSNVSLQEPESVAMRDMRAAQPEAAQPMNAQAQTPSHPAAGHEDDSIGLRGGGTFCFCIPIPCNCDICCI